VKTNLLFFTKGKKTSKIWYYDITHVKVGKKSPMTLAHFGFGKNGEVLGDADLSVVLTEAWAEDENSTGEFPSYARLLSARGTPAAESRYSWTVDFDARRKQARDDMKPHVADAEAAKAEVVSLKEKLKALKSANPKDKKIEALVTKIGEQEKASREAQSKADAIDAAVFDLKAVNPNAIVKIDTRTSEEVIESIADQSKIVSQALEALRTLLKEPIELETGS
jgi:type I restriction enzyme M protein